MRRIKFVSILPALACAVLAVATSTALAAQSDWSEAMGGRVRLVAAGGGVDEDGTYAVGIEIALDKGWKTYWRTPGDAGIPPLIAWNGSENLAGADIAYPVPHRFADDGGTSIGYSDGLILPVRIRPLDAGRPTSLALQIDFGLCKNICVPASGSAMLTLAQAMPFDGLTATRLEGFARKVPGAPEDDFRIVQVTDDPAGGGLIITATVPDQSTDLDLLAEGPEDWYLRPPEAIDGEPSRWRLSLAEKPEDAVLSGTEMRFTLINGNRAIEQLWRLD